MSLWRKILLAEEIFFSDFRKRIFARSIFKTEWFAMCIVNTEIWALKSTLLFCDLLPKTTLTAEIKHFFAIVIVGKRKRTLFCWLLLVRIFALQKSLPGFCLLLVDYRKALRQSIGH